MRPPFDAASPEDVTSSPEHVPVARPAIGTVRRLPWCPSVLALALLFPSIAQAESRIALYAEAEGWAFAEPVPVDDYTGDWHAPLGRGGDGFAFLHLEAGVRIDGLRVGIARQRQFVVEASRDAARLYHRGRNDQPAAPGERFDVDVDANFYDLRGFRFAREFAPLQASRATLTFTPALTWWDGQALEDGRIAGVATADADGELQYSARLDHIYSDDAILDRPVTVPRGRGASLDFSAHFSPSGLWSADLAIRNALGRMWWHRAPRTIGYLDSDTRQTDDDGAIDFAPTLSGRETRTSHRQRLPLFATMNLHRTLGEHRLSLGLVHTEIASFPSVGWSHGHAGWRYGLDYLPSARGALHAHLSWRSMRLRVGANELPWEDARQLGLLLAFEIPLDRLLPRPPG